MSLEALTFTDKTPKSVATDPKARLRAKLLERLDEQIGAAQAAARNEIFTVQRRRWIVSETTGEKELREVPVRVRPWWWKDEMGTVLLTLRYGNKPLSIKEGKTSIQIGTADNLVDVLETVRSAVGKGELDDVLTNAKDVNPLRKAPRKR